MQPGRGVLTTPPQLKWTHSINLLRHIFLPLSLGLTDGWASATERALPPEVKVCPLVYGVPQNAPSFTQHYSQKSTAHACLLHVLTPSPEALNGCQSKSCPFTALPFSLPRCPKHISENILTYDHGARCSGTKCSIRQPYDMHITQAQMWEAIAPNHAPSEYFSFSQLLYYGVSRSYPLGHLLYLLQYSELLFWDYAQTTFSLFPDN